MIAALRIASASWNAAVLFGVPWLLGLSPTGSALVLIAGFACAWWGSARVPAGADASPDTVAAAGAAARRLAVPSPRFVRAVDGWAAASVRSGLGYGLLVGRAIRPEHLPAVLAHEIAHHLHRDLLWEPFTDGPARLLLEWGRTVPPFGVVALPFLVLGAPLARATELRADRTAAGVVPSYPVILQEFASFVPERRSLLYPSLASRARISARRV